MNKPVAWMSILALDHIGQKLTDVRISLTKTDVADIPLYTHSVKELTDEEIKQVWNDNLAVMGNDLQFAKAILRKAQEK